MVNICRQRSQFRFRCLVATRFYEQPQQAFPRPIPHLTGFPAHAVDKHVRVASDGRRLGAALSKHAHFVRDGALPNVVHAKAEVQHVGERERGKELALGRDDQTDGV